jgi:NADH-quinone oxidoreductase subunit C
MEPLTTLENTIVGEFSALATPRRQQFWEKAAAILREQFPRINIRVVGDWVQEVTLEIPAEHATIYRPLVQCLRDQPNLSFRTLIDVCGVDYSAYGEPLAKQELIADGKVKPTGEHSPYPNRYAVVGHFLSLEHNVRVRVKVLVPDDDFPVVDSLTPLHPSADWFEREAFDLFGIAFNDHEDLRRLLTDYGFIGHPFRKDFPVTGFVEMRFDPEQHRVIYEPVSIERRDLKPQELRPEGFAKK